MHSKALNSTPSHLSSFRLYISPDIFLWGDVLSLTLSIFFDTRGFNLGSSHRGRTISIAWSFQLKLLVSLKHVISITSLIRYMRCYTLDIRDLKKDKELGHSDHPNTSKSNDKKRKSDRSMANVERLHRNKEYQTWLGEFEGLLDRICIFQS
jgi:hypothetical protein